MPQSSSILPLLLLQTNHIQPIKSGQHNLLQLLMIPHKLVKFINMFITDDALRVQIRCMWVLVRSICDEPLLEGVISKYDAAGR